MNKYLFALAAFLSSCISQKKVGIQDSLFLWKGIFKESLVDINGNDITRKDSFLINSIQRISDESLTKMSNRILTCDSHFTDDDFYILYYYCEGEAAQNEIIVFSRSSKCEIKGVLDLDNSFKVIDRAEESNKEEIINSILNSKPSDKFVINRALISHVKDSKIITKVMPITRDNIDQFDSLTIWYKR